MGLVLLLVSVLAAPARGGTITYGYTGAVQFVVDPSSVLTGVIGPGTAINGSATIDSSTPNVPFFGTDDFLATGGPNLMTTTVATLTVVSPSVDVTVALGEISVGGGGIVPFSYLGHTWAATGPQFFDYTATGAISPTGVLPTTLPQPGEPFGFNTFVIRLVDVNDAATTLEIVGQLTAVTVTVNGGAGGGGGNGGGVAVPLPTASMAGAGLAALLCAASRSRRLLRYYA